MKNCISKTCLLFLFVLIFSCTKKHKFEGEVFYPSLDYERFLVEHFGDSIIISSEGNVGQKKYILTKEGRDYYINMGSYNKLFLSNSIYYSDSSYIDQNLGPQKISIVIKRCDDDLYESTIFINVTDFHRNPLLSIVYDKDYKIVRIKQGIIFLNYDKEKDI